MDEHKRAYKLNFQKLRELKGEIERIQKLLERSRMAMQKIFKRAWRHGTPACARDCGGACERRGTAARCAPRASGRSFRDYTKTEETYSATHDARPPPQGTMKAWMVQRRTHLHHQRMPRKIYLTGNEEADADIRLLRCQRKVDEAQVLEH